MKYEKLKNMTHLEFGKNIWNTDNKQWKMWKQMSDAQYPLSSWTATRDGFRRVSGRLSYRMVCDKWVSWHDWLGVEFYYRTRKICIFSDSYFFDIGCFMDHIKYQWRPPETRPETIPRFPCTISCLWSWTFLCKNTEEEFTAFRIRNKI